MRPATMPFLDGFCRGLVAGLLVLLIVLASSARAAPSLTWRHAIDVPEVSVELREVTRLELLELLRKHDRRESLVPSKTLGFSLLIRNARTGAYRCELYVLRLEDVATIEHETRHCNGWVHP